MPKKQKLKNKLASNFVGNLTGKIQERRLQDNRTSQGRLLQVLPVCIVTFVETLGSHLKVFLA